MEHLSTIVPRTLIPHAPLVRSPAPPDSHPRLLSPKTLAAAVHFFERQEALENPDVTFPLSELSLTDDGLVAVPGQGRFGFTDWSQRQCSTLLGLRWNVWFENASSSEVAAETNRRFRRATTSVRLRTSRPQADDECPPGADGWLRAMVSPGYTAIPDSVVADTMATALSATEPDARLIRFDLTDRSTCFVVAIGKPFRPGGDAQVGDVWGGLLVRNSGVGYASLLLTMHLTRLICQNGMQAPMPDALLVRRRHRGLSGEKLASLVTERFENLPGKLAQGAELLQLAARRQVQDMRGEALRLLEAARLPQRHLPAILSAYEQEPMPTAFGLSQAVTLAAQSLSPEERLELEQAAGEYLRARE